MNPDNKKNDVPFPPYYVKQSSNSNWRSEEGTIEQVILGEETYWIVGRGECQNMKMYVIEAQKQRIGYSSECPICRNAHVFQASRPVFYAFAEQIDRAKLQHQEESERQRPPMPIESVVNVDGPVNYLRHAILGKYKGIQGESNSCYMDATLFCMFAYNDKFDHFLNHKLSSEFKKFQQIFRNNIVYPLRSPDHGFVKRDAMYHFRKELSKVTEDQCFQEVERDPSEFLRALEKLFSYSPIKTGHPEQTFESNPSKATSNMIWEMFDANFEKRQFIKIADIFRNSLSEIPAKLLSVPPVLILMAPRHTSSKRSYPYIIPDREISIDGQMLQVSCRQCDMTNCSQNGDLKFLYCQACLQSHNYQNDQASVMALCYKCLEKNHRRLGLDEVTKSHAVKQISGELSRLRLFAVLCIETSHYVAFVRCSKNTGESEWVFFDSMSDRIGNITNVPCVSNCPKFEQWIEKAENDNSFFRDLEARRNGHGSLTQRFPGESLQMLRLFRDGAFFFYENMSADYF